MQLDLGVHRLAPQAGKRTVLALAEQGVLRAREDQRIALHEIRTGRRTDQRLMVLRQRRIAVCKQGFRVQLDLARGRVEAQRDTVDLVGELAVARLERDARTLGVVAQPVEREARGRQLVAVGRVDVPLPEVIAETETDGEVEDNLGIGTSLAWGRGYGPAQLNQ